MAINIAAEVALLKKLKQRFVNTDAYLESIQDMYEEGLITAKAFREIINELAKPKITKGKSNRLVPQKVLKSIITKQTGVQEIDPCSHGNFTRTSC